MQKLRMGIALAMALGASVSSWALAPTPESVREDTSKSCASRLAAFARVRVPPWVSALALSAVILPPAVDQTIKHSLHHHAVAAVTGDRHLGNGIYFNDGDWARVLESLRPRERALLEASARDDLAIVKMFTKQVWGDYDETRIPLTEITDEDRRQGIVGQRYHHYPWGIRGSHFVVAKGQPRGNCEHKARVLTELLRRSGLDARLERAMLREGLAHAYVVVRLPDGEWIADGTNDEVELAESFRERNVAYLLNYFGKPLPEAGK